MNGKHPLLPCLILLELEARCLEQARKLGLESRVANQKRQAGHAGKSELQGSDVEKTAAVSKQAGESEDYFT